MTTGKTIALTRQTFVGKVMPLLFNILPRLVITFLPRSKCLLVSWLQSPTAVILEPPKIKSDTVSTVSPSISHEVMGPDAISILSRSWRQCPEKGLRLVRGSCYWLCPQNVQQLTCVGRCGELGWDGNQVVRSYTQQYVYWDTEERPGKFGLLTVLWSMMALDLAMSIGREITDLS